MKTLNFYKWAIFIATILDILLYIVFTVVNLITGIPYFPLMLLIIMVTVIDITLFGMLISNLGRIEEDIRKNYLGETSDDDKV